MTSLSVEPIDGETEKYGLSVSSLQSNIEIVETEITGTSKKVTSYTGFSDVPEEQDGNFLALGFEATEGSTITTQVVNGTKGEVTVTDGFCVYRITDNQTQKIRVTATKGGDKVVKEYGLSGLTLES